MAIELLEVVRSESPRRRGWIRQTGTVRIDAVGRAAETESIWLDVPPHVGDALDDSGNAYLAWLAPLAASTTQALRLRLPVDATLLANVQELLRVWRSWFPDTTSPVIDAAHGAHNADPSPPERRTGAFFTGGVDSFFTALQHAAGQGTPTAHPIDELIYVEGFDVPLENAPALERVTNTLSRAADALGKPLLVVATNLRTTTFGTLPWGTRAHGAALAGVAHLLGRRFKTVFIASSAGYRDPRPWGSHPQTDPLFTSSGLQLIHDGAAFMRVEKTVEVARSSIAMQYLRVCFQSADGANCGRCARCYRTMLTLEALDALDSCAAFNGARCDPVQAARLLCQHDFDYTQLSYVRELAATHGRQDIVAAIDRSVHGSRLIARQLSALERWRRTPVAWRVAAAWERRLLRGWIR